MIIYPYIALSGLFYMFLSIMAIKGRRKYQIAYGYGDNNEIRGIVSAHGNYAAYTPFTFFLLYLYEIGPTPTIALIHFYGAAILLGRIIHYISMTKFEKKGIFTFRVIGMALTFIPLAGLSIRLLISSF